jgi:hypothetical protein
MDEHIGEESISMGVESEEVSLKDVKILEK